MIERSIVCGPQTIPASLPDGTHIIGSGLSLPLEPAGDLDEVVAGALDSPLDRPALSEIATKGMRVVVAFDDPTAPCYAPVWATALPAIVDRLVGAGVKQEDMTFVCANSLHRRFTLEELAKCIGIEFVGQHRDRIVCHDAEDPDGLVRLGVTPSGFDVEIARVVTSSDLTVYLNCSTTRGFSGGWKSVCVGLSGYGSIHHHHTPDIMSMSIDRNRMHEILDEMGSTAEKALGEDRFFKLETVLSNPLQVHAMYGGSVWATRSAAMDTIRAGQSARRELLDEKVDMVVYGVPDWSPYAAFSHTNPILDLVSTALGYLGGMIQALGRDGCTAVIATPAIERWNMTHHPAYKEVWEKVIPVTKDPDEIRAEHEPAFARRADYIDLYRNDNAFHPVHATMALYPLKRLRHARRVIVVGAEDPGIPRHLGFDVAPSVADAIAMEAAELGRQPTVAFVDIPAAFNRS